MSWLTSLPTGTLMVGWLALALLVAALARLTIRTLVPAAEHDDVQRIASPLMPARGAAFAIFTALTLPSEAAYIRSAESLVSDEATATSRLAWAATSPGQASTPRRSSRSCATTCKRPAPGNSAAPPRPPVTTRSPNAPSHSWSGQCAPRRLGLT